jgi:hypothetical protein
VNTRLLPDAFVHHQALGRYMGNLIVFGSRPFDFLGEQTNFSRFVERAKARLNVLTIWLTGRASQKLSDREIYFLKQIHALADLAIPIARIISAAQLAGAHDAPIAARYGTRSGKPLRSSKPWSS